MEQQSGKSQGSGGAKPFGRPRGKKHSGPRTVEQAGDPSAAPIGESASEKPAKPAKQPNKSAPPKCKIVIRKLPASKDYSRDQFEQNLRSAVEAIGLDPQAYHVDHFIDGKISRKRGPVFSAGFVVFADLQHGQRFLQQCPGSRSFLPDELNAQPEVQLAPFPKGFKLREKPDKLVNTFESDPEFLHFKQKLDNPGQKSEDAKPSAPLTLEEKMRANPLLTFLREKAERRLRDRGGGLVVKDKKKARDKEDRKKRKKEKKEREKDERRKEKERKKKERAAAAVIAVGSVASGEGPAMVGEADPPIPKKEPRGRRDRRADVVAAPVAGGAAVSALGPGDDLLVLGPPQPVSAPRKLTILRRDGPGGPPPLPMVSAPTLGGLIPSLAPVPAPLTQSPGQEFGAAPGRSRGGRNRGRGPPVAARMPQLFADSGAP